MITKDLKTIGIDARFYGPVGKGLGRYTQEIVDNAINLLAGDNNIKFVIFLSAENFEDFVCDGVKVRKILIKSRWYTLAEQLEIPYLIWREKISLMHFPHFNVPIISLSPFVVTIHDLILTKFPTHRASTLHPAIYWLKDKAYRLVISSAVRKAKKIITVSDFTKNDLIEKFKVASDKIIVTYEGVADLTKSGVLVSDDDAKKILDSLNISSPYLLYVGNAYPHKNLEGLIRIFSKIHAAHANLRLVLVGKEDYFYSRVKEFASARNLWQRENHNSPIVFPGYVSDANLDILFKKASVYVFPSLYEGFGLPPLEAMAHGCPVVSSNRASMPEILGEAAWYFNPDHETEAAALIEKVLKDDHKREEMIDLGYHHVKKFSWLQCAQMTCGVYEKILNNLK